MQYLTDVGGGVKCTSVTRHLFFKGSVSIVLNGVIHTDLAEPHRHHRRRQTNLRNRSESDLFKTSVDTCRAVSCCNSLQEAGLLFLLFIVEQLIEAVRTRPLLWNTDLEEYRDRNLKDTAWGEIAEQLEQNIPLHYSNYYPTEAPLAMLPASTKPTDRAETMSQYVTDVGGGVNCTRHLPRYVTWHSVTAV
ncbi:hypothetical protein J6590_068338 [Homalodisca vitripennis]|nr:hypothetical protein J6590_068338 [Homalodisca vitripennis]